jgi:hypothetical protein
LSSEAGRYDRVREEAAVEPIHLDPAAELRRRADRISSLIVSSDYPEIDIQIEIAGLRRWCREHIPDRVELFDRVYGSRFRRLMTQFR